VPKSVHTTLADPNWRTTMQLEFDALTANMTWTLVPHPPSANVIIGKRVFKHKFWADGSFEKYKAQWLVLGFTQRAGVDFGETFMPVIKSGTIRMVLTIAANKQWPMNQLDVTNAFLHDHLQEQVFSLQPVGFVDESMPDAVCSLSKSSYGPKQAPHAWFNRLAQFAASIGFQPTRLDSSMFVYKQGGQLAYLLLYVDDMILTT
jgi:hypothetical protein